MRKISKHAFLYLLITSGIWAFLLVVTTSYNRLSPERIEPANLTVKANDAYLTILDRTIIIDTKVLSPEREYYFWGYLGVSDEIRWISLLGQLGTVPWKK